MKVCPECKQTNHMVRKSFPYYIEDTIFFNYKSDTKYDIDGPYPSEDSRQMDEFSCTECGYLYVGNDIELIVLYEMVEEEIQ